MAAGSPGTYLLDLFSQLNDKRLTDLSSNVRVRVLQGNRDAVLLADSLDLLDESHDGVELLFRFADRHLELLVSVNQTL